MELILPYLKILIIDLNLTLALPSDLWVRLAIHNLKFRAKLEKICTKSKFMSKKNYSFAQ